MYKLIYVRYLHNTCLTHSMRACPGKVRHRAPASFIHLAAFKFSSFKSGSKHGASPPKKDKDIRERIIQKYDTEYGMLLCMHCSGEAV